MIKQITALILATTKHRKTEYNTTEDTTTDYGYDHSTKTEYMRAKYDTTEDTTTDYDYDYSTTEETMAKNDTAIENDKLKSRMVHTRPGTPKTTRYGQNKLS